MSPKPRYIANLVGWLLLIPLSGWTTGLECKYNVEVTLTNLGITNCELKIVLENTGKTPILMHGESLPWILDSFPPIALAIVGADSGFPVAKTAPFCDAYVGTINLQPGQKLEGIINLHSRYKELMDQLRSEDVIVFWSYKLRPVHKEDYGEIERKYGHLLVPRLRKEDPQNATERK